jgi:hypothetical protein
MLSKQKAAAVRALETADHHIEPGEIVDAARDPSSVLHDEFPWDDKIAAEERRLDIARGLIRFVRMETVVENVSYIAPMYTIDPTRPPKSQRYIRLTTAGRDREVAERIVVDELNRILAAIRRAQSVAGVLGLSARLEAMLSDATTLRTKAERAALRKPSRSRRRAA